MLVDINLILRKKKRKVCKNTCLRFVKLFI